jgi:hypothetical protein
MEEAGNIAKKYLYPEGKVSGYTSRTGFMDSGLRELITQECSTWKTNMLIQKLQRIWKNYKTIYQKLKCQKENLQSGKT